MARQINADANRWWIARWSAAAGLLITPLATQIGPDWRPVAFLLTGSLIVGSLLLYELVVRRSASAAYGAGIAIAVATSFLLVWINIVAGMVGEDHPANLSFFMLILVAAVGAYASFFRAEGLARTLLGVAGGQALVAVIIATAPSTERPLGVLMLCSFFATLWLISAACFWKASRS